MNATVEVLDPRTDPEPSYWADLRRRAGLRADWAWEVLAVQAWCARTPQFVTVLHEAGRPCGVVSAAWVGSRTRRNRFVSSKRGGRLGGLDVRAPGTSSLPGWWFAAAESDGGCRELLTEYVPMMREVLGRGLRALLLRQVPAGGLSAVDGRFRLVRETESVAVLRTDTFGERQDWMATLAKKRRQNLRKIFRTVDEDETLDVRVTPGSEVEPARVAELVRYNESKHHDVPIVPLPQFVGYLERLLRQPDVFVLRYLDRGSGRLLAIATILDDPEWPVMRTWSALPVELGGRSNLYFHFYGESVRWSIESGKSGVILGKKMAETKRTLGAELIPQYAAAVPLP
ncbi:GNAT family N-acetyltransferase [Amycolatopsis palatopharyngis]|uniref:GNAT family N-acetyltransferase n=1 Tax=Amycolatopsis palatopharyngis TaxID=187982 RepID=UPI000E24A70A|nr:GNAT family N-acetyltransferase [Amycolatopsis palatopharyngis]